MSHRVECLTLCAIDIEQHFKFEKHKNADGAATLSSAMFFKNSNAPTLKNL